MYTTSVVFQTCADKYCRGCHTSYWAHANGALKRNKTQRSSILGRDVVGVPKRALWTFARCGDFSSVFMFPGVLF